MKIKVLIPIFNDWQSLFKLLENIDHQIFNLDAIFIADGKLSFVD